MSYDVYGLGNALVDMEFSVDDSFLRRHGIAKGHMTLIDEDRLTALLGDLRDLRPKRTGGGSAANTMYATQAFGARTFYACKVASDETGSYFRHAASTRIHTRRKALAIRGAASC
jgi:sugar/nucleoside kinase (ribokinase family)